jgi:hypothetical protein
MEKELPPELELYLIKKYINQIRNLSQMLGHRATSWLKDAEDKLLLC